jgi:hypothetical protein
VAIFKNDVVMAVDRDGNMNYMGVAERAILTFGISYGELGRLIQYNKSFKSPSRDVPVWFSVIVPDRSNAPVRDEASA